LTLQNQTAQKQDKLMSLRTRFIAFALILGSLLVIGTFISHFSSKRASENAFLQLSFVSEQSSLINSISTSIINANRYLNLYLLATDQEIYKIEYADNINTAQEKIQQLQQHSGFDKIKHGQTIVQLQKVIEQLNKEVKALFVIRVNPNLQYPSMDIAFNQMQPSGNTVAGAIDIAVKEIESNGQMRSDPEIYQTFFHTQQIWTSLISEFRIYLANRMGSFNEAGLKEHEINIESYYIQLVQNMSYLKILDRKNKLDFESSNAVSEVLTHVHKWKKGFNQVTEIHHSKYWRTDSLMMYDKIIPLTDKLLSHLDLLEQSFKEQNKNIVTRLTNVSKNQDTILLSVILFFIIYILSTLISIERMVFKPIAAIANILKSKDINDHNELQKHAKTTETRNLVNAYKEMQHQVVTRQKELEHQTLHDELTKLPNRIMLRDRIDYHLSLYKRKKNKLALFSTSYAWHITC